MTQQRLGRTDEDITNASLSGGLVSQPALVRLETGETNGHLGHDARQDGTETFVEGKWSLAPHDVDTSCDESSGLRLYNFVGKQPRLNEYGLTPGVRPDFESCIRTLIVSRGWHASYAHDEHTTPDKAGEGHTASHAPAIPPAVMWTANPTGFLLLFRDMAQGCGRRRGRDKEADGMWSEGHLNDDLERII